MALFSGGVIAIGGSLVWPDKTFKWADLGALTIFQSFQSKPGADFLHKLVVRDKL